MQCLHGYTVLRQLNDNIQLISDGTNELAVKTVPLQDDQSISKFNHEVEVGTLMGKYGVGPQVYQYRFCDDNFNVTDNINQVSKGLIFMEKLDGTLPDFEQAYPEDKEHLRRAINLLIESMHSFDIAHGDLHADNIGYKILPDNMVRFYFIDYQTAYNISTGETNPIVINWMRDGFDWDGTYEEFVQYDYDNWFL